MKVILDIKDNKAVHLLEVLKELPYVKTTPLTVENAEILYDLKEAASEMRNIKSGIIKARNAEEFLNEL